MRRVAAILMTMALAGCGTIVSETFSSVGTSLPVASQPPASASRSASTPVPSVDRLAAGTAYKELADAYNATLCRQMAAINSGDLAQAKAGYGALARANRTLADGLRALELPPELAIAKQRLVEAFAAVERSMTTIANAPSVEEFNTHLTTLQAYQAAAGDLSNFLRGELGITSTPGSC